MPPPLSYSHRHFIPSVTSFSDCASPSPFLASTSEVWCCTLGCSWGQTLHVICARAAHPGVAVGALPPARVGGSYAKSHGVSALRHPGVLPPTFACCPTLPVCVCVSGAASFCPDMLYCGFLVTLALPAAVPVMAKCGAIPMKTSEVITAGAPRTVVLPVSR